MDLSNPASIALDSPVCRLALNLHQYKQQPSKSLMSEEQMQLLQRLNSLLNAQQKQPNGDSNVPVKQHPQQQQPRSGGQNVRDHAAPGFAPGGPASTRRAVGNIAGGMGAGGLTPRGGGGGRDRDDDDGRQPPRKRAAAELSEESEESEEEEEEEDDEDSDDEDGSESDEPGHKRRNCSIREERNNTAAGVGGVGSMTGPGSAGSFLPPALATKQAQTLGNTVVLQHMQLQQGLAPHAAAATAAAARGWASAGAVASGLLPASSRGFLNLDFLTLGSPLGDVLGSAGSVLCTPASVGGTAGACLALGLSQGGGGFSGMGSTSCPQARKSTYMPMLMPLDRLAHHQEMRARRATPQPLHQQQQQGAGGAEAMRLGPQRDSPHPVVPPAPTGSQQQPAAIVAANPAGGAASFLTPSPVAAVPPNREAQPQQQQRAVPPGPLLLSHSRSPTPVTAANCEAAEAAEGSAQQQRQQQQQQQGVRTPHVPKFSHPSTPGTLCVVITSGLEPYAPSSRLPSPGAAAASVPGTAPGLGGEGNKGGAGGVGPQVSQQQMQQEQTQQPQLELLARLRTQLQQRLALLQAMQDRVDAVERTMCWYAPPPTRILPPKPPKKMSWTRPVSAHDKAMPALETMPPPRCSTVTPPPFLPTYLNDTSTPASAATLAATQALNITTPANVLAANAPMTQAVNAPVLAAANTSTTANTAGATITPATATITPAATTTPVAGMNATPAAGLPAPTPNTVTPATAPPASASCTVLPGAIPPASATTATHPASIIPASKDTPTNATPTTHPSNLVCQTTTTPSTVPVAATTVTTETQPAPDATKPPANAQFPPTLALTPAQSASPASAQEASSLRGGPGSPTKAAAPVCAEGKVPQDAPASSAAAPLSGTALPEAIAKGGS